MSCRPWKIVYILYFIAFFLNHVIDGVYFRWISVLKLFFLLWIIVQGHKNTKTQVPIFFDPPYPFFRAFENGTLPLLWKIWNFHYTLLYPKWSIYLYMLKRNLCKARYLKLMCKILKWLHEFLVSYRPSKMVYILYFIAYSFLITSLMGCISAGFQCWNYFFCFEL